MLLAHGHVRCVGAGDRVIFYVFFLRRSRATRLPLRSRFPRPHTSPTFACACGVNDWLLPAPRFADHVMFLRGSPTYPLPSLTCLPLILCLGVAGPSGPLCLCMCVCIVMVTAGLFCSLLDSAARAAASSERLPHSFSDSDAHLHETHSCPR